MVRLWSYNNNYTITITYIILKCRDEIFKIVMLSNHIRSKLALTCTFFCVWFAFPKKNYVFVNFNKNVNLLSIFAHFSPFNRHNQMDTIKSHYISEIGGEYHIRLTLPSPTQQFSLEPEFSFTETKMKSFKLAGRDVSVIQIMHWELAAERLWGKKGSHKAVVSVFHTSVMYMLIGFWSFAVNAKQKAN